MKVERNLSAKPGKPSVVTIGCFDGIHLGHRRILSEVAMLARGLGLRSVVVTFEPHPLAVLQPDEQPFMLTTTSEKIDLLRSAGINATVILEFSAKLASRPAEWFVREILLRKLSMRRLVIGYDFRFGRGRQGSPSYVEVLGERLGFGVDIIPPVTYLGSPISSTRVRTALMRGDVTSAADMLGRPYGFKATVVRGEGRGKHLSFPTANLRVRGRDKIVPAKGVYAVRVDIDGHIFAGALYIGSKPTFRGDKPTIEVYIVGTRKHLYGKTVRVEFIRRLRGEKRFASEQELRGAIDRDVKKAIRVTSI